MNMVLRRALKAALVLASSSVAIPYAVSLIANMLYGWPTGPKKYSRALNPRKVYLMCYAVMLELTKVRYVGLYYRWNRFYRSTGTNKLIKDIPFGTNDNSLDVYLPDSSAESGVPVAKPVIVFVYGGTWGSGDKSMYGLLCSQLACSLHVLVVCPNYSIFPKGFVDDMVQDIGETIQWVKQHASTFGGNKDEIILLGHSAGAHLAALTVLELCIKRLVDRDYDNDAVDATSFVMSTEEVAAQRATRGENLNLSIVGLSSAASQSFHFAEKHFNGSDGGGSGDDDRRTGSERGVLPALTGSFLLVEEERGDRSLMTIEGGGQGDGPSGAVSESFCIVDEREPLPLETTLELSGEDVEKGGKTAEEAGNEGEDSTAEETAFSREEEEEMEMEDDAAETTTSAFEDDLLTSIKLVIGLAGVYDITEHYEYETSRGVEDISTMARAMYDPKHFKQFSPTSLATALPLNIRLPPFHLIHGDSDLTVPVSSSVCFGEALWNRGVRSVQVVILPKCDHADVCLDLMEPSRTWHDTVLMEIGRAVRSALK